MLVRIGSPAPLCKTHWSRPRKEDEAWNDSTAAAAIVTAEVTAAMVLSNFAVVGAEAGVDTEAGNDAAATTGFVAGTGPSACTMEMFRLELTMWTW